MTQTRSLARADLVHGLNTPAAIVALRKVGSEVPATTLFAAHGGARNQAGDRDDVAKPPPFEAGFKRLRLCTIERPHRRLQIVARAKQAGASPHQIANGIGVQWRRVKPGPTLL